MGFTALLLEQRLYRFNSYPNQMPNHISLPLFVSLFLFTACGPDYLFQETREIPNGQWTYADTLDYALAIEDTTEVYSLFLELGHTTSYGFQNLYVRIHTRFPDGQRPAKVVSLELADKAGIWAGDCSNQRCTVRIPLQENAYFNQPGEYLFTIEQFMRQDSLPGVERVAFLVQEAGKKE